MARAFKQLRRLGNVATLAGCQDDLDGPSFAVGRHMDLGGQSSSGTPQSLVAVPPFPVAAC